MERSLGGVHLRYVGGKSRLWKHILPIMLEGTTDAWAWVEPFVGSAVVISQVPSTRHRVGSDSNPYIIALHKAIQAGWKPPEHCSEQFWRQVRDHRDKYPPELVAFVGFGCSFAARWFEGYARSPKTGFDHAGASYRNLMKMAPLLQGIEFQCCDYRELVLPPRPAVVYCDPPYLGSTHDYYPDAGAFDHDQFWAWTQYIAAGGYRVFVSEFQAPPFAKLVWEKQRTASLDLDKALKKVDRLYLVS